MRIGAIALAVVAVGVLAWTGEAGAERVKSDSAAASKATNKCARGGGLTFTQSPTSKTYGCLAADGHGIVCGGETEEQKKTCDIFRTTPPRLPGRDEALAKGQVDTAERPAKAAGTP